MFLLGLDILRYVGFKVAGSDFGHDPVLVVRIQRCIELCDRVRCARFADFYGSLVLGWCLQSWLPLVRVFFGLWVQDIQVPALS